MPGSSNAAVRRTDVIGAHAMLYSTNPEADRAFFRDVLGFATVDAGQGWPILECPPTGLAIHPAQENGRHDLYLMCDDVTAAMRDLQSKGIACRALVDQVSGFSPR